MMKEDDLDELREAVRNAEHEGDRTEHLLRFLRHPKALWEDFLDGLPYPFMGDCIAFRLHDMLQVEIPKGGPIQNRKEWEAVLKSKNIDLKTTLSQSSYTTPF
jgi:hypothetical protein